jgi:hypothetical protein
MDMALGRQWLSMAVASLAVVPHLGITAGGTAAPAGAYAGTTYYVDAKRGDDSAPGTSPGRAWRSLGKAGDAALKPGDTLLFMRGGSWHGTLTLSRRGTAAHPIEVGVYGTGARPKISGTDGNCVVVEGSYWRISGLRASGCEWAGFELRGDRNDLRDVYADRNVAGVLVDDPSSHNVIRDSALIGNDRMSVDDPEPDNDSGAFGVLLNGDDNLVTGNLITGSYAPSHDYVTDGAAVEVFNGDRNRVTFNLTRDNDTFTELGHDPGSTASGNLFAGNVVTSSKKRGSFLITRGAGNAAIGPVVGTVAVSNSVYLPARTTIGFSCSDGCSGKILRLRNNAIKVGGITGADDGSGVDDGGGVYSGSSTRFSLGPRSVKADPRFRGPRDLRLRPGSPAIGRGLRLGATWYGGAALAHDIAGESLGGSGRPDAGAYQH